jgi:hypothetical protein
MLMLMPEAASTKRGQEVQQKLQNPSRRTGASKAGRTVHCPSVGCAAGER